MKYRALVKKIVKLQDKITPVVEAAEEAGLQDGSTHAKMAAAVRWAQQADLDLGDAEVPALAPDITPVVDFANHLFTYQDAFDEATRSHIELYREYVQDLFQRVEEAGVRRA